MKHHIVLIYRKMSWIVTETCEQSPKTLEYVRNYTSVRAKGIKVLSRGRQVGRRDIRSLVVVAFAFLSSISLSFIHFFHSLAKTTKVSSYIYVYVIIHLRVHSQGVLDKKRHQASQCVDIMK